MPERRVPLIAGNWKMHKTAAEARAFVDELLPLLEGVQGVEVAVCAPFTALPACVEAAHRGPLKVLAQNMHEAREGAFTGEVSAPMLTELGVVGAVLGHSERRQYFGETDRALQEKVPAAIDAGLLPILCVGETEEERDAGDMERKLRVQVQEGLEKVPVERLPDVVVAYEPIWAIGTGRVASPEQAQEAVGFVRALVGQRSEEAAQRVRILYGGSVKPENAREILAQEDVDGALVGGASLEAPGFARIVEAAAL